MSQQQTPRMVASQVEPVTTGYNSARFGSPDWYRASTLEERAASLRTADVTTSADDRQAVHDRAARRVARWRSLSPFATDVFQRHSLTREGLTEDDRELLLGEPVEAVCKRASMEPDWLQQVRAGFSTHETDDRFPGPEPLRDHPLLTVIEPSVQLGRKRLREGIRELSRATGGLHLDIDSVEQLFADNLAARLGLILNRVMVLEMHVARLRGLLEGSSSEERFQSFVRLLRNQETRLAILEEYPVLARQITTCVDQWVEFSLEFLRHLCADWQAIRSTFGADEVSDELVSVDAGVADAHRGGRSVLMAAFGSGMKVVYKPRSLSIDTHFQELLAWINQRGSHSPFRTLKVLDRGDYGWVEFVEGHSCRSREQLGRFYQRQGGYLAVLYALQATDFHAENLIASGEHPVLLDLEALFHPSLGAVDHHDAEQLVGATIEDSVLRVGLLPQPRSSTAESEGVDISGLGGQAGQLWPHRMPYWEANGTDQMHLERKHIELPASQNRPRDSDDLDVSEFTDSIVGGFTSVYQLLLEHRDELLSSDGPLARFADDEIRVILRPTSSYAVLLDRSRHPDFLRDALDRDLLFSHLWLQAQQRPPLAAVTVAECRDLHQNDIPRFTTRPRSRDLWTSSDEPVRRFFGESGMDRARRCLKRFGGDDLARQTWFISTSLSPPSRRPSAARPQNDHPTESSGDVNRERLLAAARAAGDRLSTLAVRGHRDASWIGLTTVGKGQVRPQPLGPDLYDGLPGVALFLGYLGSVTGDGRYTDLALAVIAALRKHLQRDRASIRSIGSFTGWGGVIYALTHLGVLWDQPHLFAESENLVPHLSPLIEQDERLDIIAGSAGCAASLLALLRYAPSERVLGAARRCGDRLLARAVALEHGIGWNVADAGSQPLTGFSHGAAGIASVLLELAEATGEARFRQAASEAIAYERSVYCEQEENWPDLRGLTAVEAAPSKGASSTFMTAWCHGAPGIGLARLRSLPYLDDAETRAEVQVALQTTLRSGFGANHCLCHGDLGNIEFLQRAGELPGLSVWADRANQLASAILESLDRNGPLCGAPRGIESPGLMTGIAGIGYGLLRLAEPERIPSVLMLESPGVRGGKNDPRDDGL